MKHVQVIGETTSEFYWNRLWILLFGVGFAIFFCVMPKYYDDYWFLTGLDPWFVSQGLFSPDEGGNLFKAGVPWRQLSAILEYHYNFDNFRLTNVLTLFFLILPKWLGSGIMAVLWVWSAILGIKSVGIDIDRSPIVPLCLTAWTFFMPWSDHFGSLNVQFNYILPCFFSILLFCYLSKRRGRKESAGYMLGATMLGLFLGVLHEGFSAPVFIGLAVLFLVCRRWRTPAVIMALSGLMIGCLFLLNVPGARLRSELQIRMVRLLDTGMIRCLIEQYCLPLCTVFVLTVILLAFPKLRKRFRSSDKSTLWFGLASGLAVIGICIITHPEGRAWFWLEFVTVLMLACVLQLYGGKFFDRYRSVSVIMAAPLLTLMFLHLGCVDMEAFRFRAVMKTAIADLRNSRESFVFSSDESLARLPLCCGSLPDIDFEKTALPYVGDYLGLDWSDEPNANLYPVIIPRVLRNVDSQAGEKMDGGGDIRVLDGEFFMSYDKFGDFIPSCGMKKCYKNGYLMELDFGKGYRPGGAFTATFRSERDGKWYVWIKPELPLYLERMKKLQRARMVPARQ